MKIAGRLIGSAIIRDHQNDFAWREGGSRIYGPGTMDIKGGTPMVFMMLDALRHFSPDTFESTGWVFALNAAEEPSVPDFAERIKERINGNVLACLAFESGRFRDGVFKLVTSRKGRVQLRIEVEGRAAHSGTSHPKGVNAIRELARSIEKIESLTNYKRTLTCNVGVMGGGELSNRVPQFAWAEGEIRGFDEQSFSEAAAFVSNLEEAGTVSSPADGYSSKIKVTIGNLAAGKADSFTVFDLASCGRRARL